MSKEGQNVFHPTEMEKSLEPRQMNHNFNILPTSNKELCVLSEYAT